MDATMVTRALFRHFENYDYKLANTFLYDWESDFSAQSKSGYWVECEVKVSKSDFRRDFEKEKHHLFRTLMAGRTHYVSRHGEARGDLICGVRTARLSQQFGPGSRKGHWNYRYGDKENPDNWNYDWRRKLYVVNDYGRVNIEWCHEMVYAPATRIHITPLESVHLPHQFYFACPEGLIQVEDLPPYAGLIWVSDSGIGRAKVVKRAPYMHKRSMDMRTQLLKKYYNLWEYKVGRDDKFNILKEQEKNTA